MRRAGLILAVATREEINQWTHRHRGRREIARVRVAPSPPLIGERAPGSAAEIAELSVWALKKALHVAEIDTALMEDITFAFINGLYMKLQGA